MKKTLLILFILSFTKLSAIDSYFDSYSVVDGLSNSSIKVIYQDKLGFIWFGTKDGLNRFDGNEFRIYRFDKNKSKTVFNNDITCITPDRKGNMWIGTFEGIALFNPYSEQFFDFNQLKVKLNLISGVVTEIYVDNNDRIWISTKKGLYIINPKTYDIKVLLKGVYVSGLKACLTNNLLIDVEGKGLALVDSKTLKISYLKSKSAAKRPILFKIFKDTKGRVWLGASTNNLFLFQLKINRKSR